MGVSRAVSEIDGDFSRISQNFPTLVYFAPPLRDPLGIGYRHRVRKKAGIMGLPDGPKSFKIVLAVVLAV